MRQKHALPLFLLAVLCWTAPFPPASASEPVHTALDDYVAQFDPSYTYSLHSSTPLLGLGGVQTGMIHVLNMTSQTWRSAPEFATASPNKQVWRHWLHLVVPDNADPSTCLLVIEGGSVRSTPNDISEYGFIAGLLGVSVAYLQYIPNEPVRFAGEGFNRTEDSIIAYTYDKYMDLYQEGSAHPDPSWPLLLPMTKAAVRAMDAAQEFLAANEQMNITQFIVGGASKRGWTTWLTAAADPQRRVAGVVPIVIDVLNMRRQIIHHKNAYSGYAPNDASKNMLGGYSTAIKDYTNLQIFDRLETNAGRDLARIVDPLTYRDRLTMPKLIFNSTGDQFFLPDGIKFYFDYLPGKNYVYYLPNTDHGLNIDTNNMDVVVGLLSFVKAFIPNSGVTFPDFDWSFEEDGSIRIAAPNPRPSKVTLWQAHNAVTRDFRLQNIGPVWTSSLVDDPENDGIYTVQIPAPTSGWTGFYATMTFGTLELSTGLRVLPDTYPNGAAAPDVTAPEFANLSATPPFVRAGQAATLAFSASEPLAAPPTVTVNGHAAALVSENGQDYVYSTTPDSGDPEGPAQILIEGMDLAENPGSGAFNTALTVDNTPPAVTAISATPNPARPGDLVTITVELSEPLMGDPAITVNGRAAEPVPGKANAFSAALVILESDPYGGAVIAVTGTDTAGNSATETFNGLLALAPPLPLQAALLPVLVGLAGVLALRRRDRRGKN